MPVDGYLVRRYDAGTAVPQPITSGSCALPVAATTCTHSAVPAGSWRYTVTPSRGAWRGPESPAGQVSVAGPVLELAASAAVRPGATVSGSLSGLVPGETVSFRLDTVGGPVVAGTLVGAPTPATVPASGGGAVTVVVPAGTSDGPHPVLAVAGSGESATASATVDGTPPGAPVLTRTPADPSGDSAVFEFTQADPQASSACQLDGAAYAPCSSPVELTALPAGGRTFAVRSTDLAGNVGVAVSYTWTVSTNVPNVSVTFPSTGARLSDAGFAGGCGTPAGDLCGTADDEVDGIAAVAISLRRASTGLWWTGTGFTSSTETFLAATGTDVWSYAIAAASLPEGDYQLRARAMDGGPAPGTVGYDARTFSIDRTAPPAPTFTSAPSGTTGPDVSVAHATSDPGATLECQLDGAGYLACVSPQTLTGLSDGPHTFAVRAVDAAGNPSPPVTVSWTVDAVAPQLSTTFPAAGPYRPQAWTDGCATPAADDLCGTSSDARTGVVQVQLSVRSAASGRWYGGAAFDAVTETWLTATGTTSWSYQLAAAALPDGAYTLRVRAVDGVANSTTTTSVFTLDGTPPPQPDLLDAPMSPGGSTAAFTVSVAEAGALLECRLDGPAWTSCGSSVTYAGLLAGPHAAEFRATDAAGNVSAVRPHEWVVDPDLPSVVVATPAAGRTYGDASFDAACGTPAGDVCGTASDAQGVARVEVSLVQDATGSYWNGAAFSAGTRTWLTATGTTTWSLPFPAAGFPAEGGYTVTARVTDAGGRTALDVVSTVLDRTAPATPVITAGPSGTTGGADTFSFTAEAGAAFECRRDGGAWLACTSPTSATSPDGPRTFDVRAVDAAGNRSAAASRSWSVDTGAPTVTTTFAVDGGRYNDATYGAGCGTPGSGDLCGTAADTGSGVALVQVTLRRLSTGLYWNGTGYTASTPTWLTATGTTSWSYAIAASTFLAPDSYALSVRATDAVGGTSATGVTTFAVDRSAPSAAAVSAPTRGTARKMEAGDQVVLAYSEAVAPGSVVAGWDGTGTRTITARAVNSATNDRLTFYNDLNSALLPLGDVRLGSGTYVTGAVTWGGPGAASRSTLTLSGGIVTITLGTPSASGSVATVIGAALNMSWRPRQGVAAGTGVTDLAGNFGTTTTRAETDNDNDF